MIDTEFTLLSAFSGSGIGTHGALQAEVRMLGHRARLRSLGGIDLDAAACADFEYLTDSAAICADIGLLSADELRRRVGARAPDCVLLSPPCTGGSGLISDELAETEKYIKLNRLALAWMRLMLETWSDEPPALIVLENVPRLRARAGHVLDAAYLLLDAAGYEIFEGSHCCGEIGALAQRRRRMLMVARHKRRCAPLLYRPLLRRVRGVGEVLSTYLMPDDPAAGPMHELPRLSLLTLARLAAIPPGGDYRDLTGVLAEGQPRRSKHRRYHVAEWESPSPAVSGPGTNGAYGVAQPLRWFKEALGVLGWNDTAGTVTGRATATSGRFSVDDIRVADLALTCAPHAGAYGVTPWDEAVKTITASACVDNGPFAVEETRVPDGGPMPDVTDPRAKLSRTPIILAKGSTMERPRWHRPFSTLDLAALMGLPTTWKGKPLQLHGRSHTAWRQRIGNGIPAPTARAVFEQILITLLQAKVGFSLSSPGDVWVTPEEDAPTLHRWTPPRSLAEATPSLRRVDVEELRH